MNYCSNYTLPEKYNTKINALSKRGSHSLFKLSWPTKIFEYLSSLSETITDITLNQEPLEGHRFNILAELCTFLNSESSIHTIQKEVIDKLEHIAECQHQGKRITSSQRYFIRKHFELDKSGIDCIGKFETHIRDKSLLTEEGLLLLNPYTSILNLNEIYVQVKYKYVLSYKYKGLSYKNINLYTPGKLSSERDKVYLEKLLAYVCLYPYVMGHDKLETGPKTISLYLVHFPKKFMIAKGRDPLVYTSSEINTGVCDMVNIAVTRKEEALKTVLHELFHYYDMDFKYSNKTTTFEKKLTKQFRINNKLESLNLFEAYTECMASIINIICWSFFDSKQQTTPVNITTLKESVTKMFAQQITYTLYKLAKILKLNKCGTFMDSSCELNQTTNVASYFIFKLFLYFELDTLLKTCVDSQTPKFIETQANFSCLMDILSKGANNKVIASIVNYLLESGPLDTLTSARMTCIDS
jgi:hypothetical protein